MSTAIVTATPTYTPEQIELIKRTLCPGATSDELAMFIGQCKRTGLDPFSKQIHAVKRKAKDNGQWVEKLSIQVGIDGFRLIADRTNQTDGQDGPFWCDDHGNWTDVWIKVTPPRAAKVIVYRKGQTRGYTGIASYEEYCQRYDNKPNTMWAKMPATMLAKCAECLALRKAFPQELSGLYSPDEMAQADVEEPQKTNAKQIVATPVEETEQPDAELVNGIQTQLRECLNLSELDTIAGLIAAQKAKLTPAGIKHLREVYAELKAKLVPAVREPGSEG